MSSVDCLFCKILANEIPSDRVYEDEKVVAFKDIHPLAKIHILFIHRKHSHDLSDMCENDLGQVKDVFNGIPHWPQKEDLRENGIRVVTNIGPNALQSVFHTHFHVLAGEKLGGFGR